MADLVELAESQLALLRQLATGDGIFYSQDGEVGWLSPSRIRLEDIGISDAELQALRDAKLIGEAPDPDEEYGYRFSPPDIITEAGRRALSDKGRG